MKIGFTELILVFIVALIVLGPDKLPYYAKKLGEALAVFRSFSAEATKDIKESVVDPLNEAQKPLKEALEPLSDLDKSLRDNVRDIKSSFADIGKGKQSAAEASAAAPRESKDKISESGSQEHSGTAAGSLTAEAGDGSDRGESSAPVSEDHRSSSDLITEATDDITVSTQELTKEV